MIVIIANKLKNAIESSPLKEQNYKCANGYFSARNCADNIKNLEIDKLIIDITAIRDVYEMSSWKNFKEIVDPTNIYVLLDNNKSYSNVGFLSMLITMGIYNFAKTTSELISILERPNEYEDVAKYQKMAMVADERRENAEDKIEDYERKNIEHQEMMQDYMKKYQEGEFEKKKKPKVFKDQIIAGLVMLPLFTFISTLIFYILEWIIYSKVSPDTYLGNYLYTPVFNSTYTPLVAIGILISTLIFTIYYNVLDPKIKRKQMSRGKFMILPIGIFCVIIFGDYYLFEIIETLFSKIPLIANVDYLYQSFYGFNMLVATVAILLYCFKIAIANSKELKFEIDLNQKFTLVESLLIVAISLVFLIPFSYWLSNTIAANSGIYKFMNSIHEQPFIMPFLSIVILALTAIVLITKVFYPNKEVVIKEKEEF